MIAAIAGYLVRALYARNFTVAEYGLFYSVLTFIFLFNTLRNLGFDSSQLFHMNKFLARLEYKKAKAVLFIALIPQMILSILIAAIIFLLKPYLVSSFFKSPISGSMIIYYWYFLSFSRLFFLCQAHLAAFKSIFCSS